MKNESDSESKLVWLLLGLRSIEWDSKGGNFQKFYDALEAVSDGNYSDSDLSLAVLWTSSRISEGYAHMLKVEGESEGGWAAFERIGEIHLYLKTL